MLKGKRGQEDGGIWVVGFPRKTGRREWGWDDQNTLYTHTNFLGINKNNFKNDFYKIEAVTLNHLIL